MYNLRQDVQRSKHRDKITITVWPNNRSVPYKEGCAAYVYNYGTPEYTDLVSGFGSVEGEKFFSIFGTEEDPLVRWS